MKDQCPICYRTYTAGIFDHIEKCRDKRMAEEARRDAQEEEERRNAYRKAEGFDE